MSVPRIRVVPTGSGARAVQVIWHYRDNKPVLDHIGSAHTAEDLALLKARAQRLIDDRQSALAIDTDDAAGPVMTGSSQAPLAIVGERAEYLIDAIQAVYHGLGFDTATDDDKVFEHLVMARLVHPGSTLDSIETLAEIGVSSASYATIKRRLPVYATPGFQDRLTRARDESGDRSRGVGALRRHHAVFRDRHQRRAPDTRVLEGAAAGAPDHGRAPQ